MFSKDRSRRFADAPGQYDVPGPGSYPVSAGLMLSTNPGLGLHSGSSRFTKENSAPGTPSVSSLSDDGSCRRPNALGASGGPVPVKGLPVADASLRDAAVRRKQLELEAKTKQLSVAEARCSRLETQLEEQRARCEAMLRADRELRASYSKRETEYLRHDRIIGELQRKISVYHTQNEAAYAKIEELKVKADEYERLKAAFEARVAGLERDVGTGAQSLDSALDEVEGVAGDLHESALAVHELQHVVMGLESERKTLLTALLTRETELAHANNRAEALKEELFELEDARDIAEEDLGIKEGQVECLRYDIAVAEEDAKELRRREAELINENRDLQEALFHCQNREEDLYTQSESLESELQETRGGLKFAREGLRSAEDKVRVLEDETASLTTACQGWERRAAELEAQLDGVRAEFEHTQQDLAESQQHVKRVEMEKEDLAAEAAAVEDALVTKAVGLENELKSTAEAADHFHSQVDALSVQVTQLYEDKRASDTETDHLRNQLSEAQSAQESLSGEVEAKIQQLEDIKHSEDELHRTVQLLKHELDASGKEWAALAKEVEVKTKDLHGAIAEAVAAQATIAKLADARKAQDEELRVARDMIKELQELLEAERATRIEIVEKLERKEASMTARASAFKEQLDELQALVTAERAEATAESTALRQTLEEQCGARQQLESALVEARQQAEDERRKACALEDKLRDATDVLMRKAEYISRFEVRVTELEDALSHTEAEANGAREENMGVEAQHALTVLELRRAETQRMELEQRAETQRMDLEQKLRAAATEAQALSKQLAAVQSAVEERDAALVEKGKQESLARQQLQGHKERIQVCEALESRVQELEAAVRGLEHALMESEERNRDVDAFRHAMELAQEEVRNWRHEAGILTSELQRSQAEVENMKSKLAQLSPMEKQLMSAKVESQIASFKSEMSAEEVKKLTQMVSELVGHHNQRQKIKHLQTLKLELLRLQRDNKNLELQLSRTKLMLKSALPTLSSSQSDKTQSKETDSSLTPRRRRARTPLKEIILAELSASQG